LAGLSDKNEKRGNFTQESEAEHRLKEEASFHVLLRKQISEDIEACLRRLRHQVRMAESGTFHWTQRFDQVYATQMALRATQCLAATVPPYPAWMGIEDDPAVPLSVSRQLLHGGTRDNDGEKSACASESHCAGTGEVQSAVVDSSLCEYAGINLDGIDS
jgi:hypothetical protein